MAEYVHLIGAEQVERAAQTMLSASAEMQRAVANMEHSFFQLGRELDDFISRFEAAVERLEVAAENA